MADKYTVQEPPRVFGRDMAQYLSSEFHRIEYGQHIAYKQWDRQDDAGPHVLTLTPQVILSYTAPANVRANSLFYYGNNIENTDNQFDSINFWFNHAGLTVPLGSAFIDQTTSTAWLTSYLTRTPIIKGEVITIEAAGNKRTGHIVTNSELTILEF